MTKLFRYNTYGPMGGSFPKVFLNDSLDAYQVEYTYNGEKYLLINGKTFGPFESVKGIDQDQKNFITNESVTPTAVVKEFNGGYWAFTGSKKYGPFDNEPTLLLSDDGKKATFLYHSS